MRSIQNILGGMAGAVVLNLVHETARQYMPNAPRVDLIGKEAINKSLTGANKKPLHGKPLYITTLGADIAANALYYSLAGAGNDKNIMLKGVALGLAAGIGALTLTDKLGLDDSPVNRTTETKLLTVAWYTLGGIIAAATIKALRKKTPAAKSAMNTLLM